MHVSPAVECSQHGDAASLRDPVRRTLVATCGAAAIALLAAAGAFAEESPQSLVRQAAEADGRGDYAASEKLCVEALRLHGDRPAVELSNAYYYRGRARFCLGRAKESVADFDRYVELAPSQASRQWERGIACYYAGEFAKGAEQFALYQTYHDNDVENSVWRFLCMARMPEEGFDKARAAMLPIRDDRRVPMMQIYELFRGKLEPAEVLAAIDADRPGDEIRSGRLFYARLYLGLYYEAQGNAAAAREQIQLAAERHRDDATARRVNGFMWAVADVHWRSLQNAKR